MVGLSSQAALTITNGMRIVEFGDSISTPITSPSGMYVHYLESFYTMRYPTLQQHWRAEGRSGGQITNTYGASADPFSRYDQRVIGYRPNLVSILLTPNGAQAIDVFSNSLYSLATTRVVNYTSSGYAGGIPLLLGTIPQDKADGAAQVRDRDLVHSNLAVANGWNYSATWHYLYPNGYSNNFANGHPYDLGWVDITHFGLAGHLTVAYAILSNLGEDGLVSTALINATAQTSSQATNCSITSITGTSTNVTFSRLDTKLPMCWDAEAESQATAMFPGIITNLNRYMLYVTNLTAGNYRLKIDGVEVGTYTNTVLLAGLNLTTITNGPIWDQRIEVLGRIRDKQGMDRTTFQALLTPTQGVNRYVNTCIVQWNLGLRDQALIDAVAAADAAVDAYDVLIKNAAQPVNRTFVLENTAVIPQTPPTPMSPIQATGNLKLTGNVSPL